MDNGSMRFQHGPLALAMTHGGLFLLNEIDLLDPATAAGLNGVLDGAPICIPENGGEVIAPHPMFRFVATANTNSGSDGTGLYQGTLRQNLAFMDRFWLCEVAYPDSTAEIHILERRAPALPADLRSTMVEFANEVRRLFIGDSDGQHQSIEVTFIAFPGSEPGTVVPLLRHGERPSQYQDVEAKGMTPMGEALWWVLQRLSTLPEQRRMVLIITDGSPDGIANVRAAIKAAAALGVEVYGLGIDSPHITTLLPGRSRVIAAIGELAGAVFSMLEQTLV